MVLAHNLMVVLCLWTRGFLQSIPDTFSRPGFFNAPAFRAKSDEKDHNATMRETTAFLTRLGFIDAEHLGAEWMNRPCFQKQSL